MERDFSPLALETEALDRVHALLGANPDGLTVSRIAHDLGLGIGYVEQLLKKSTCVLKRKGFKWIADWNDLNDWLRWRERKDFLQASFVRYNDGTLVRIYHGQVIAMHNVLKAAK
jgi:hypothetical protein